MRRIDIDALLRAAERVDEAVKSPHISVASLEVRPVGLMLRMVSDMDEDGFVSQQSKFISWTEIESLKFLQPELERMIAECQAEIEAVQRRGEAA